MVESAGSTADECAPSGRALRRQWLFTAALFLVALFLYTRHNTFPFYYHPDEPGKVAQIREGTRNFHHPLALLTATELLKRLAGRELDCQGIAEVGRWVSAIFGATAVAAFSWLGFRRFGLCGGIVVGTVMLLQRRPCELAHFMKEDCALLAGIALTFVAIDRFWSRPSPVRAASLGAAAALAASGKYVGIIMLLPVLLALLARRESFPRPGALLLATAGFFAALALINYPGFTSFGNVIAGIQDEIVHLNSRAGVETRVSPFGWVRYFLEVSPVLLLFLVARFALALREFRRLPRPDLLLLAAPFAFGLLLSFSSKQGGRYALPMTETAALLGVLGALELWKVLRAHGRAAAAWAVVALLSASAVYDLIRTARITRAFARDHRRELIAWIQENVSATARLAVEERV